MSGERVERELEVVALAQQHAERTVALAALLGRLRKPPAEHRDRPVDLGRWLLVVAGERVLDQLPVDSASGQGAADPLAAPPLQVSLVLGQQARVPGVIDVALVA